jgi:purine-nucleoside/S-methyl-5'-thioadenosine phosphorylase / adenosine deaminase
VTSSQADRGVAVPVRHELPGGAQVLFTSCAHANLSTQTGDGHEHGRAARDRLCEHLGLDWLCASRQVHGATVQRVREIAGSGGEAMAIDADGHATALAGVGVMVLTADCLPVALGAEMAGGGAVVAMAHAGWRGLAAGVLEEAVRALHELGATGWTEAVVGPCAGGCCYEVGEEVHAAFGTSGPTLDLKALARRRLEAAGVGAVHDCGLCTIHDERFFSHRRDRGVTGRQAGVAWRS